MYKIILKLGFSLLLFVNVFANNQNNIGIPFIQLGHKHGISAITFTKDGKYVITHAYRESAKLWDVASGRLIRTFLDKDGETDKISITSDGKFLFSTNTDSSTIKKWNLKTGKIEYVFKGHNAKISTMIVSKNNHYLYSGGEDKTIKQWDIKSNKIVRTFNISDGMVENIILNSKNNTIIAIVKKKIKKKNKDSYSIIFLDINTSKKIKIEYQSSWITPHIEITENDQQLLIHNVSQIDIINLTTNKIMDSIESPASAVQSFAVAGNGKFIIIGDIKGELHYWNCKTKKIIKSINPFWNITALAISPDSKYILAGNAQGKLKLFNSSSLEEIKELSIAEDYVNTISQFNNGKNILSGGFKTVKLWNIQNGNVEKVYKNFKGAISSIVVTSDGIFAASFDNSGQVKIWNLKSDKIIKEFKKTITLKGSLTISSNNKYLLVSSDASEFAEDYTIFDLLAIKTGKVLQSFKATTYQGIHAMTFTFNSQYILYSIRTGINKQYSEDIYLLDIYTGEISKKYSGHKSMIRAIYVTKDDKYFYTLSLDNSIRRWNIKTGESVEIFHNDKENIYDMTLSSDNQYLLILSKIGLYLLDTTNNKVIKTFYITEEISDFKIHNSGKFIILTSSKGIKFLDIKTGKEVLHMVSFEDDEWVAITPEGYFNVSDFGGKYLNVLNSPMESSSVSKYYKKFHNPDKIKSILENIKK